MIDGKDTSTMTLKEANEALLHATKAIRSFKLGVVRYVMTLNLLDIKHALGVNRMIIHFCKHVIIIKKIYFSGFMTMKLRRTNHLLSRKL